MKSLNSDVMDEIAVNGRLENSLIIKCFGVCKRGGGGGGEVGS